MILDTGTQERAFISILFLTLWVDFYLQSRWECIPSFQDISRPVPVVITSLFYRLVYRALLIWWFSTCLEAPRPHMSILPGSIGSKIQARTWWCVRNYLQQPFHHHQYADQGESNFACRWHSARFSCHMIIRISWEPTIRQRSRCHIVRSPWWTVVHFFLWRVFCSDLRTSSTDVVNSRSTWNYWSATSTRKRAVDSCVGEAIWGTCPSQSKNGSAWRAEVQLEWSTAL